MSKNFKSLKSFEAPSIASPQFAQTPLVTRSITTKRQKNSTSSIHILAQTYLNRAKHILNDDTNKFIVQVEKLDDQLEKIKVPVAKVSDTMKPGVNVGGVLTKEWSFFTGNATPMGLDKYKVKDFILPELKSSKSVSRLGKASIVTTGTRASVMSWLANYATSNANNTMETVDVDRTDRDTVKEEKMKENIVGEVYSVDRSEQSTIRSDFIGNFESVLHMDRDDSSAMGSVSRRSDKKATMKLVRHGAYKVPEELYETIVRRKKIMNEMKRGGKNIEKVLKVEQEPPKKKGGRSVSVLPKQLGVSKGQ